MRTTYIQRTTEDLDEDMDVIRNEVDHFIDGTVTSPSHGLDALAEMLI